MHRQRAAGIDPEAAAEAAVPDASTCARTLDGQFSPLAVRFGFAVHLRRVSVDRLGQRREQLPLDRALERPGAVANVVSLRARCCADAAREGHRPSAQA